MARFRVRYRTTGKILGGRPVEQVATSYMKDLVEGTLGEKFSALNEKEQAKELEKWGKKTLTTFRRTPANQLALGAVQLHAGLKETANVCEVKGKKAGLGGKIRSVSLKQALQHGIRVYGVDVDGEQYLPLSRKDKALMSPDGLTENFIPPAFSHPACIKVWEHLTPGVEFEATLEVRAPVLTKEILDELTSKFDAIGSGRGQGHGEIERVSFEEMN